MKNTKEKNLVYLPIKTTEDVFTIGACGKFYSEKKHLNRVEANYLYLELHKWLFGDKTDKD